MPSLQAPQALRPLRGARCEHPGWGWCCLMPLQVSRWSCLCRSSPQRSRWPECATRHRPRASQQPTPSCQRQRRAPGQPAPAAAPHKRMADVLAAQAKGKQRKQPDAPARASTVVFQAGSKGAFLPIRPASTLSCALRARPLRGPGAGSKPFASPASVKGARSGPSSSSQPSAGEPASGKRIQTLKCALWMGSAVHLAADSCAC